jgi:hypothetical protein
MLKGLRERLVIGIDRKSSAAGQNGAFRFIAPDGFEVGCFVAGFILMTPRVI